MATLPGLPAEIRFQIFRHVVLKIFDIPSPYRGVCTDSISIENPALSLLLIRKISAETQALGAPGICVVSDLPGPRYWIAKKKNALFWESVKLLEVTYRFGVDRKEKIFDKMGKYMQRPVELISALYGHVSVSSYTYKILCQDKRPLDYKIKTVLRVSQPKLKERTMAHGQWPRAGIMQSTYLRPTDKLLLAPHHMARHDDTI
jgi:hypothetical protein